MKLLHLPLVGAAVLLAPAASAQTVYGDAGRADPAFAPYGVEAYRAIVDVCLPNADGRLSLKPDNAAELARRDVTPVLFPPEWKIRAVRITGGKPDWAERSSSNGRIFFATLPAGRLCETDVFDAPTRGRIYVSLDAALRDGGWRLRRREAETLELTRRVYEHPAPGRSPDAVLTVTEFVYGGGPVRHLRLSAVLKSYR